MTAAERPTGPYPLSPSSDPIRPTPAREVTIEVAGQAVRGISGQTIAGVLMAEGRSAWRRTSRHDRPRGVFCGIGVCFDCLVVVNGLRDVRACQRRAVDGDVVQYQNDTRGPGSTDA